MADGSGRRCVFCGCPPAAKTKEHILPRWLLRMTGDPNRRANFGPKMSEPGEHWEFSFDSFHFPACRACNEYGAQLEERAAPIVAQLLSDGKLNGHQLSTLLDWLDKVRVGLWLAHAALEKNFAGVSPQFHIRDRVRLFDRALLVYRAEPGLPALGFAGTFGLSFQYSPVAFMLRIHDIALVNVSFASLCSRELGFPYPRDGEYTALGGAIAYEIAPPGDGFCPPFCSALPPIPAGAAVFFQPVLTALLKAAPNGTHLNEHVKRFSAGMPAGVGQVFRIASDATADSIGAGESAVQVVPVDIGTDYTVLVETHEFVLDVQRKTFAEASSVAALSEPDRTKWSAHLDVIDRTNGLLKKLVKDNFRALTRTWQRPLVPGQALRNADRRLTK